MPLVSAVVRVLRSPHQTVGRLSLPVFFAVAGLAFVVVLSGIYGLRTSTEKNMPEHKASSQAHEVLPEQMAASLWAADDFKQQQDQALSCQTSDFATDTPELIWPQRAQASTLDSGCWITAAQAHDMLGGATANPSSPYLVDVRTHAWREVPISNALEIPLWELKDKPFLAAQGAILVGSGLDLESVNQACLSLQASGIQTFAILGGAPVWLANGKPVVQSISAAQWVEGLGQGIEWQLWMDEAAATQSSSALPMPVAVPLSEQQQSSPQTIAQLLATHLSKRATQNNADSMAIMLVLDQAPEQAMREALESAVAEQQSQAADQWLASIYLLQGGWSGYQTYVEQAHKVQTTAMQQLRRACGLL